MKVPSEERLGTPFRLKRNEILTKLILFVFRSRQRSHHTGRLFAYAATKATEPL